MEELGEVLTVAVSTSLRVFREKDIETPKPKTERFRAEDLWSQGSMASGVDELKGFREGRFGVVEIF